jgi:hypothetical protein
MTNKQAFELILKAAKNNNTETCDIPDELLEAIQIAETYMDYDGNIRED